MSVLELNLESLEKIYGRDTELQSLEGAWKALEQGSHETVLVYGHAGSGKTTLVRRSLERSSAIIGAGKFDQLRSRQPFAALSTALTEVLDQLLRKEATCSTLQDRLEGSKLANLFPLIPNLSKLVAAQQSIQDASLKAIENSLIYLMREIPDPVILFMDDLQFADEASLELLIELASDHTCQGVGYVFCYRDTEIDSAHPWDKRLRQLESATRLHVKDLSMRSINELLCDLTERRDCEELAALVHDKSGGNIFYTLQLLEVLQNKSLLYYDLETYRWMWKAEGVRDECNLSDNVVDLVVERLGCLDTETVEVLQVASCLGARFDVNVLTKVLSRPVESNLEKAVQEGLISETRQSAVYKWAHDRIQEAVYGSMEDASSLHWRIGNTLKPQLLADDVGDATVLAVIDQLNRGRPHMREEDRHWLVERNIEAARVAVGRSAFFPALDFVNAGIAILGEGGWLSDYKVMLELSMMAVRVHFAVGDIDGCLDQIRRHHSHATNIEDELPVYPFEIKAILTKKKLKSSLDRGLQIVRRITQERFPRYPSTLETTWYGKRIKSRLCRLPLQALLDLPDCSDYHVAVAIEIMGTLSIPSYCGGESNLLTFLCLRSIELTLEHGLVSAFPFALFCMIAGSTGDYVMTYELAEITLELIKRCPLVDQPRSTVCVRLYGVSLRKPLHLQINPVLSACKTAMEVGEVFWSGVAATAFVRFSFFAGTPLVSLQKDAVNFHRDMLKYGHDFYSEFLAPCIQVILNLTSSDVDSPEVLAGRLARPEAYMSLPKEKYFFFRWFNFMRVVLAVHFMDLDLCEEAAEVYWRGKSPDGSHFERSNQRFYHGLVGYALARLKRKRKHYRRGRQMSMELRQLVKFGNVNCAHLLLILQAEEMVLGKASHEEIKRAYDRAISASARSGFVADAALASQRAGLYFTEEGDSPKGMLYLQTSIDLYEKWGASAVVNRLTKKYGILPVEQQSTRSTSRRARHSSLFVTEKHWQHPMMFLDDSSRSTKTPID